MMIKRTYQSDNAPFSPNVKDTFQFVEPMCWFGDSNRSAIAAFHQRRWGKDQRKEDADNHNDNKSRVGASGHTTSATAFQVDAKGDNGAKDTTNVEKGPKDSDVFALVLFFRVSHHDGTLSGPKDTGTATKNGTCSNNVAWDLLCIINPQGRRVDNIANGTKLQEIIFEWVYTSCQKRFLCDHLLSMQTWRPMYWWLNQQRNQQRQSKRKEHYWQSWPKRYRRPSCHLHQDRSRH